MEGQTGVLGLWYKQIPYPFTETAPISNLNNIPNLSYVDMNLDNLQPYVLQSCTLSSDGTQSTWRIRPGVKSAYGNELTSQDVLWSVQRSHANKALGEFFNATVGVADPALWKAVDKYTVQITSTQPIPMACKFLAHLWFATTKFLDTTEIKKHTTASDPWANDWLTTHDASFGPYHITDWEAGKQVVMQANPNFFLGQPSIKTIIWQVVPDSSGRVALMKAGKVDAADGLSADELASLGSDPNVRVGAERNNLEFFLEMDNSRAPFNDQRVRQAMNLAVPRDQIASQIYKGLAVAWQGVIPTIYPGYIDMHQYDFDLTKAKSLLTAAGYSNGFSVTLSYPDGDAAQEETAILLQSTYAQIGIHLTLQKLPPAALSDLVTSRKAQLGMWLDAPFHPDPNFAIGLWFTDGCCNWQNYSSSTVNQLIAQCRSVVDWQARIACHAPIQTIVYNDASQVWILEPEFTIALNKRVKGWGWNTNQSYYVYNMSLT
jgi:peptide/nickel transport system substrate-binding protein